MDDLTKQVARQVIDRVGGPGQPPDYGFQYFSAGLGPYLGVIEAEYLHDFIREGGSSFKIVVGPYGGGKTHLLVGFGLLVKHPTLRKKYCGSLPYARAFEVAEIAAFNGRNNPDHFFWGEIANQRCLGLW